MDKGGIPAYLADQRLKTMEALMECYAKTMPREAARQRVALLPAWSAASRAEILDWFDMRWPE